MPGTFTVSAEEVMALTEARRPIRTKRKVDPNPLIGDWFELSPLMLVEDFELPPTSKHIAPPIKNPDLLSGIEIEVENFPSLRNDERGFWSVKEDGSLRKGGLEYVTVPLKGVQLESVLHRLMSKLTKEDRIHFSPRTSIHVHVNVRNFTFDEVGAVILVYLAVEPLLYSFVGKNRDESIFCVPLYATDTVNKVLQFAESRAIHQEYRYLGFNLHSLTKFGTIEFRHLHGTSDLVKIINWINLVHRIVQYGKTVNLTALKKEICDLNTNSLYLDFLQKVFHEDTGLFDLTNLKASLEKGVKSVKQSVCNNTFLRTILKDAREDSLAFTLRRKYAKEVVKDIDPFDIDFPDIELFPTEPQKIMHNGQPAVHHQQQLDGTVKTLFLYTDGQWRADP